MEDTKTARPRKPSLKLSELQDIRDRLSAKAQELNGLVTNAEKLASFSVSFDGIGSIYVTIEDLMRWMARVSVEIEVLELPNKPSPEPQAKPKNKARA